MAKFRSVLCGDLLPAAALLLATVIWGSTFFLTKGLLFRIPPLDFVGTRFSIAAVVMVLIFFRRLRQADRGMWLRGLTLGAAYALAQMLQTWGLTNIHASVSGFVTGMCIVFTPILVMLIFKVKLSINSVIAVLLASVGLAVLSLNGFFLGWAETVTLGGALLYAVHLVFLSHWAKNSDIFALAAIQMIGTAGVTLLGAIPGGIVFPTSTADWIAVIYLVIAASVVVLVLQTWAQSRLSAVKAAVIVTMEPVFSALFAVLFGGESLTLRLVVGGSLILVAMLISELQPRPSKPKPENPAIPERS